MRPLFLLALPLAGCNDFEVVASLDDDSPMVVRLDWTTEEPGTSWVEFGQDERDLDLVTAPSAEPGTSHAFTLFGVPPLTDLFYRAVTEVDGEEFAARGSIGTGGIPADLPDFVVTADERAEQSPERYVLGTAFGGVPAVFALDRAGGWLWYQRVEADKNPIQLAFEPGTRALLYNSFLTDHGKDDSNITRIAFDRSVDEDLRTPYGHHAFTRLPDGSLAYLSIDVREFDVRGNGEKIPVVGDAINVIPAEGGEPTTLWTTWDWRDPAMHDRWDSGFYPQGGDWTHANALTYVDWNDTLLLSVRNFDMLLEIDLATAEVLREFGGDTGYQYAEGSRPFCYQHDANWTADHTLLLISSDEQTRETTALEFSVDDENHLLTEIWSHGDGDGHYALVQGSARELANGNRLVNYGSVGLAQEVTPQGEVVWELKALAGSAFGNVLTFGDFYDPLGEGE